MADTRTRITLGQALNRTEETDSSIASELYVPGHRRAGARTVRESETRADSGQDIKAVVGSPEGAIALREEIRKQYTDKHMESNNPYHRSEAYALANDPSGNNPVTLQEALNVMNSNFLKSNPRSALESGRASTESSDFFFNEGDLESFRRKLIEEVLKDQNSFFATDDNSGSFFKPDAPNEDESFPRGMFSLPTQNSPRFGRYDKNERKSVKRSNLVDATKIALQESSNDYSTFSALPRVPFEKVRMAFLLASELNLRLDANGNIYKASKEEDNKSNLLSESYGVGNDPLGEDSNDIFGVHESNQFFQYGAVGVSIKGATYALPMMLSLGTAYIVPLLWSAKLKDELDPTGLGSKIAKELTSAFPPTLIRLANELGLNGEELKMTESIGLAAAQIGQRILQGWRVLFGFYDDNENILTNVLASAIPDKVFQSPQMYFTLARRILEEIEHANRNPLQIIARVHKEPSSSLLLRLTALAYKLGIKTERKIKRNQEDIVDDFEKNGGYRNNRHKNFASGYRNGLKKDPFINPISLKYFDYAAITSNAPAYVNNDEYSKIKSPAEGQRFTASEVEQIEKKIDADYVPFSIQDLRTNEIIALPAFIDSISDNFNVNYESIHGYGRTDPVYTYSKTERSVELSFNLVAFNSQDHDRMYEIVNHLTSMCYPQRSRGQLRVDAENKKFYQPFSQIQTASPMIRVRLGNIIHSNRSQRGYAQLFGNVLGDTEADATTRLFELKRQLTLKVGERTRLELSKEAFEDKKVTIFDLSDYDVICNNDCKIKVLIPGKENREENLKGGFKIKVRGYVQDGGYLTIVSPPDIDPFRKYRREKLSQFYVRYADVSYNDSQLATVNQEIQNLESQIQTNEPNINSQEAINFLKSDKNPITRSFQTTSGKGLACFIKSFSLDYNNAPWDIDAYGGFDGVNFDEFKKKVAPTRIKINMSLAPIHDIPLGLSYDGTIMAPSHPVGNWALDS
jgi:hypothetical protein